MRGFLLSLQTLKFISLNHTLRMKASLFVLLATIFHLSAFGTHLRCGHITVNQLAPGSKTVRITVEVFTNTVNTNVEFGDGDHLDFGDGSFIAVPYTPNTIRYDINPDGSVASAFFTTEYTYETLGFYTVSYSEPHRNAGVVNYANSVLTRFYIESRFLLMTNKAYKSPTPILTPLFYGFLLNDFSASVAAIDSNQFALFYSIETPMMARNTYVQDYQLPGPNLFLYPTTGLLEWDCKFNGEGVIGEYLMAFKVEQYDTAGGRWQNVGYMYQDFQIIVSQAENTKGFLTDNVNSKEKLIEVPENTSKTIKVFAHHQADEEVAFSVVTELDDDSYTFDTYDSIHVDQKILVGVLTLTHTQAMARATPYIIAIRSLFSDGAAFYQKDINYAFITKEFFPDFGPISAIEQPKESLELSPNPFRDFVRINNRSGIPLVIRVFNFLGQLVTPVGQSDENLIDLSSLPSGMYFIQANSLNGTVNLQSRMIKE
jgi:hypothetical protein